uniref:Uncharacterized protein n=1 Tax=Lepeophtheirus salmonis TaxID=72036 RepID=A0A0K2VHX6_LEPSM
MVYKLQEMMYKKLIKSKNNCLNDHNNGGSYIGCSLSVGEKASRIATSVPAR